MTIPNERTKAAVETRDFLQMLAAAGEIVVPGHVANSRDVCYPRFASTIWDLVA